jgi:hypothetical protein
MSLYAAHPVEDAAGEAPASHVNGAVARFSGAVLDLRDDRG